MTRPAWRPLQRGDKVTIIAPGLSFRDRDRPEIIERYEKLFSDLGLELQMPDGAQHFLQHLDGKIGTPQQRAEQIVAVLKNPDIKLMFIHGGNCSDEVIECLKKMVVPKRPDLVAIGFSDADQMLHYLGQECGAVSPVEGPSPGYLIDDTAATKALRQFLFEQKSADVKLTPVNEVAQRSSNIAGNIVIFNPTTRRTSYRAILEEEYRPVLLLEAGRGNGINSEAGLWMALEFMKAQGEWPKAIILSESDRAALPGITTIAKETDVPIFLGAPFGHGNVPEFKPIALNSRCIITNDILRSESVRSLEDVELVQRICAQRAPYHVKSSAGVSASAVDIPEQLAVDVVHETEKATSWVERLRPKKEFFFLREASFGFKRGSEIPAIDGMDLSGKNLIMDVTIPQPPFDEWIPPRGMERNLANYNQLNLEQSIQRAKEILLQLVKNKQLESLDSLVLVSEAGTPPAFNNWLRDFAQTHCPGQNIFTAKTPQFVMDIVGRKPKINEPLERFNLNLAIERSTELGVAR